MLLDKPRNVMKSLKCLEVTNTLAYCSRYSFSDFEKIFIKLFFDREFILFTAMFFLGDKRYKTFLFLSSLSLLLIRLGKSYQVSLMLASKDI